VLVVDSFGATPPCGIIQYADRSWPIWYTLKDRKRLLHILDEMREARTSQTVHRAIISTQLAVAPAATEPYATRHSAEWYGADPESRRRVKRNTARLFNIVQVEGSEQLSNHPRLKRLKPE